MKLPNYSTLVPHEKYSLEKDSQNPAIICFLIFSQTAFYVMTKDGLAQNLCVCVWIELQKRGFSYSC